MGRTVAICCAGLLIFTLVGCDFQPQPTARYQTIRLNDNHAIFTDVQTGDVWYFIDAPIGVSLRYVGRAKVGKAPGEIVSVFRLY